MITVVWILLKPQLGKEWLEMLTIGAALFTGASGLLYVWEGARQLGAHPNSLPTKKT